MFGRVIKALVASILVILLTPSFLPAFDEIYDTPGPDPRRETLSSFPEERIDPFTGAVILNYVDARLPGNGGLDLVIQRTYSSKNVCDTWGQFGGPWFCDVLGEKTSLGYGWNLHFGRLFHSNCPESPDLIEMPDGSIHSAYHDASNNHVTKDYWQLDWLNKVVTLTNGTKIYCNHGEHRKTIRVGISLRSLLL